MSVTFEEGTWAGWLYDLLKPHVTRVVVCNPRKNALLKHGNKNDRIDARKLANLLRLDELEPVYHGQTGVRTLRELARSYLTTTKDLTRVMSRLKAVYRINADVYHRDRALTRREAGCYPRPKGRVRYAGGKHVATRGAIAVRSRVRLRLPVFLFNVHWGR